MRVVALAALAASLPLSAAAGPLSRDQVPAPLAPWVDWSLAGHEKELCPFFEGDVNRRECDWPGGLSLDLDDHGGRFTQSWRVYADGPVSLPGDLKHWPLDVTVDGAAAPVIAGRDGGPTLVLKAGAHDVSGSFHWDASPEVLPVPPATGLVALTLRGKRIDFPARDEAGRLWLGKTEKPGEEEARLEIAIHRKVTDDVPLTLDTRVTLKVSGRSRELLLGPALPAGFVPMALVSPLPARVEPDGHLRVQARAGTWTITLVARHDGPAAKIAAPAPDSAWDPDEVWVFDARPDLRQVSVEGVPAVDPTQTELPDDWRSLPAYVLKAGDEMKLAERRRGDADPAPDRLSLDRTMWLDFDGGGYTVHDRMSGTLSKSWRLEMGPGTALGHVAVDGRDQLLTTLADGRPAGVELRQGNVSLEADSRVDGHRARVGAVGWDSDFENVNARLWLPPGWRLFHATGVDHAEPTWVTSWDLLDDFLVLIIAIAIARLFGSLWGVAGFLALVLSWHEPGAPRWIWLFLLAGEAMVKVLPEGFFRRAFRAYRIVLRAALVLIAVPFLVLQMREALYPQLEPVTFSGASGIFDDFGGRAQRAPVITAEPAAPPEGGEFEEKDVAENLPKSSDDWKAGGKRFDESSRQVAQSKLENYQYSPDLSAQVSTGPGVTNWSWRSVSLTWRGPVDAGQSMTLFLVPPALHALLAVLTALLLAVVILRAIGAPVDDWLDRFRGRKKPGAVAAIALLATALVLPARARAQESTPAPTAPPLIDELRARLLAPPDCAPFCASSPRMRIEAGGSALAIRIEVDAAAQTAVPLPGGAQQWSPERVVLDGAEAKGLARDPGGVLWIPLSAGAHQLVLEGPLPDGDTVQLPLPLKPHRVESSLSGWTLDGVHEDGGVEDNLQLTRSRSGGGAVAVQPGTLPPFVRVTRDLSLGLSWQVTTTVERLTPPGAAVVVDVPLLPGESVTTADVRVAGGKAQVSMGPQASSASWTGVLALGSAMTLSAPSNVAWVEDWRLDASPIWHVEPTGIPPIHSSPADVRVREWRPWPGESVKIDVTRPAAVAGQTLTVDRAALALAPGLRATDATLTLGFRSSRGGQHPLTLPEGADLTSVTLDGNLLPVRLDGRVAMIPVSPGAHEVVVSWRQPGGLGLLFRAPAVDVGTPGVNAAVTITMPTDRWTLALGGPRLGPAVLFWSLLVIFLLVSIGLGWTKLTPLGWVSWFLLSLGLTQVPIPIAAIVAAWLLALGWRKNHPPKNEWAFDLVQLALPALTLIALGCLAGSIAYGLLGDPDMQIGGNGSSATWLSWYQDRIQGPMPHAWVLSVPLFVYRLAMLAWSLWLALSLLGWLKWAWGAFTEGGAWRTLRPKTPPAAPPVTSPRP